MLGIWRTHAEYQQFLVDALLKEKAHNPQSLTDYRDNILKLYSLNLDSVKTDFAQRFSVTGRPSNFQPEMFRAFILMASQKVAGIEEWRKKAIATPIFRAIIGVEPKDFPGASTLRDFITRLWLEDAPARVKNVEIKPKEKHGKNKKPPKNPGIIKELTDKALEGAVFDKIPEQLLQILFAKVAVQPSVDAGLIEDPDKLITSGDGTVIQSHASPRGIATEVPDQRKFADPQARWLWDSYHEQWAYGYMGYFFSTSNPMLKLDLPLYLRFAHTSSFDGVTFIEALAHFRSLYSGVFKIDSLLLDSAHDNYATYSLLNAWMIKPFIDLNKRGTNVPQSQLLPLSQCGAPICADGYDMVNWGYDANRFQIKYRCPLVAGTVHYCPYDTNCNKSAYGKTVYVRLADNLRLLTPVPRNTDEWKKIYKRRSASERINNRVLTDYELERPKRYGKKKLAFFTFMNAINVHLDALVKHSGLGIASLLAA
jgi:hypothetical protein